MINNVDIEKVGNGYIVGYREPSKGDDDFGDYVRLVFTSRDEALSQVNKLLQ